MPDDYYSWKMKQNFRSKKNKDRASAGLQHFNMEMRWAGKNRMLTLLGQMAHHLSNKDSRWLSTLNTIIKLAKTTAQKYGYQIPPHKIAHIKNLAYKIKNDHPMSPGKILKCFDDICDHNFEDENQLIRSLGESLGDFIGFVLEIDPYEKAQRVWPGKQLSQEAQHSVGEKMFGSLFDPDSGKLRSPSTLIKPVSFLGKNEPHLKPIITKHFDKLQTKFTREGNPIADSAMNDSTKKYYRMLSEHLKVDPIDKVIEGYHRRYVDLPSGTGTHAGADRLGLGDHTHAPIVAATLAAIWKHHRDDKGMPSPEANKAGKLLANFAPKFYESLKDKAAWL